jgi:hypothetical protein
MTYCYGDIQIIYNAQLLTLNGLNNLSSIGHNLIISNNSQLRNFCSLQTLMNNNLGMTNGFYSAMNNSNSSLAKWRVQC